MATNNLKYRLTVTEGDRLVGYVHRDATGIVRFSGSNNTLLALSSLPFAPGHDATATQFRLEDAIDAGHAAKVMRAALAPIYTVTVFK